MIIKDHILPLYEVAQEVKRVDGLFLVLFERQPAEPVRKDLAAVHALWPEPHQLSYSRDAVLCGVDVLLRPRVGCLDDADQQGECLYNNISKTYLTSKTIRG